MLTGSYTEQFAYVSTYNHIWFAQSKVSSLFRSHHSQCRVARVEKKEMSEEFFFPAHLHFCDTIVNLAGLCCKAYQGIILFVLELDLCKFAKIKQILFFSNSYNNSNKRISTEKPLTNAE